MDMMSQEALIELEKVRGVPCVTLLFPAHPVPDAAEAEDRLRLKNLLNTAQKKLQDAGIRRPVAESILTEARERLRHDLYWRHGMSGIAMFLSAGFFRSYGLPFSPEEHVLVGKQFFLVPSLFVVRDDGWFYVLAVSQKHVRLLLCSTMRMWNVYTRSYPGGIQEALGEEEQENVRQVHDVSPSVGKKAPIFHGHGKMKDQEKRRMSEYLHAIHADLKPFLANAREPIVFAGTEALFGIFRGMERRAYPKRLEGSPDMLSDATLHRKARDLLEQDRAARNAENEAEERS